MRPTGAAMLGYITGMGYRISPAVVEKTMEKTKFL